LEFSNFPSLEIIKPKIILENTMNACLFGFILMPYSLYFWKHNSNFYKWLSMSLYIVKLSKIIFIELSKYFLKCFDNNSLISWRPIFHSKRHHLPYKSPLVYKCNLVFVFWSYRNLMISWISI
jgi:hypothetical protein